MVISPIVAQDFGGGVFVEHFYVQSQHAVTQGAFQFPDLCVIFAEHVRYLLANASRKSTGNRGTVAGQSESMIAIIVISLLALVGAVLILFFRQRTPSDSRSVMLPPNFEGGLFDRPDSGPILESGSEEIAARKRKLIERARTGDLASITDAYSTHNAACYAETLEASIEWASGGQERLVALVSHISKSNELRANKQLAQLLMRMWKAAPDRRSTTQMLHIAALSDDPETYGHAVESTLELWRSGDLSSFTPGELTELLVSQYWVIAPEARRGGPGFALKRRLLNVRRELETARCA
jgi:hypothetical protein